MMLPINCCRSFGEGPPLLHFVEQSAVLQLCARSMLHTAAVHAFSGLSGAHMCRAAGGRVCMRLLCALIGVRMRTSKLRAVGALRRRGISLTACPLCAPTSAPHSPCPTLLLRMLPPRLPLMRPLLLQA